MAAFDVIVLEANEYVFLTLCAGLTLQKGDSVKLKLDLGQRTIKELGSKVSQVGGTTQVTKLANSTFEITRA